MLSERERIDSLLDMVTTRILHNLVRFEKVGKILRVRSAAAVAEEFQIMFVASLPGEDQANKVQIATRISRAP